MFFFLQRSNMLTESGKFSLLKALQKELRQELFADCSAFGEVPGFCWFTPNDIYIYIYICIYIIYVDYVLPLLNDISLKSSILEVTMADVLIIWWSFHDFLHPFLIGIAMEIVPWQSQALDALEDFNRSPEETKRAAQAPMSLRVSGEKGPEKHEVYEIG